MPRKAETTATGKVKTHPMDGSWKASSPGNAFCTVCNGNNYNPDSKIRQEAIRAAMENAKWPSEELPNACAERHSGGCLCPYHK